MDMTGGDLLHRREGKTPVLYLGMRNAEPGLIYYFIIEEEDIDIDDPGGPFPGASATHHLFYLQQGSHQCLRSQCSIHCPGLVDKIRLIRPAPGGRLV